MLHREVYEQGFHFILTNLSFIQCSVQGLDKSVLGKRLKGVSVDVC